MKRKLHFLLAVGIGLTTSVGWLHAAEPVKPTIFTDLSEAETGKTIVFNVGTAKGDANSTVRVKVSLLEQPESVTLGSMGLKYYQDDKWNTWTADTEDGSYYFFGSKQGFSLANLISPILMTPTVPGEYTCKLEVIDVSNSTSLAEKTFKVEVKEKADVFTVADTTYSTPNVYAASHGDKVAGVNIETYSQFPNKKTWQGFYTFVYGNGERTEITDGGTVTKIAVGSGNEIFLDPTKSKIVVLGGKKSAEVANTDIAMTGGTVSMLIGGGYGVVGANKALDGTAAKVETTTITMTGGTVSGSLVGGGLFYNKTKNVNISLSKTASVGAGGNWVICGGFESGCTNGTKYGEFASSTNTVEKATLNIDGGAYSLIGIGGTDGANGYVKEVTADIQYATITGGVFGNGSNGRSDKVVGTIAGCSFVGSDIEIAAINRGVVKDVNLTFNGCDFSLATNLHANIGATYRWGYNYNGSSAKVEGVPGSVSMTFIGCNTTPVVGVSDGLADADVTLTGAKAKIAKFEYSKEAYHETFTINANKTWTFNDGLSMESGVTLTKMGTLKYGKSFDANVATADELNAALGLVNAGDKTISSTINMAAATYASALEIKNPVTIQGAGSESGTTLTGKITISPSDSIDVTFKKLKVEQVAGTAGAGEMVLISGKAKLDVQDCVFTNNNAGTDGNINCVFNVASTVGGGSAILTGTTINLNGSYQHAFVVNASKYVKLEWYNSAIKGTAEGIKQQGLRLKNVVEPVVFDHSTITLAGKATGNYPIYLASDNLSFKMTNSETTAWGSIYAAGWNTSVESGAMKNLNIEVTDSKLTGFAATSGTTNDWGLITLERTTLSKVKVTRTQLLSNAAANTDLPLYAVLVQSGYVSNKSDAVTSSKNEVVFESCTLKTTNTHTPNLISYYCSDLKNLSPDNIVKIDADTKLLDMDSSDLIKVIGTNDTLRNAVVSIPVAFMYRYNNTVNIPVAYPGDHIVATSVKATAALAALNATDAIHTDYTIPDSIIVECKDAYLVTGESAAKAFAEKVSNKAVFYLKRATGAFSTVAVGNNHVQIEANKNVTWNEASNANRSVEIAAGATLTINVAMSLDTVFMAESAQLVANAAVTAKAVQLTYGTTKVWKAFGFPFAIGSVKNVAGDKEIKTTAFAKDGVWTAGIDDKEPKFTVTGDNATPAAACIIASEKDSSIVVTSTGSTLSLATKAEPNAPATKADDVKFQIISNPNLSDMTLTQTAYVLSDDGKTFDRMVNPTIKAFQSFVLADEATTNTLRSLRIGDTPTGNEIVPVEGYFVETGHGTITIHTAEPTQVIVVDMLGRVHYNARVNDGAQIAVPTGIYAVNRQKVIVK